MNLQSKIEKYNELRQEIVKLDYDISTHYDRVISELQKKNDLEGLEKLQTEIPPGVRSKQFLYQALRFVKGEKKKKEMLLDGKNKPF